MRSRRSRETLRALDTLVQQGKVRYIGCSNWEAWKIAKALGISEFKNLARFDTLQAYYSIAGRDLNVSSCRCSKPNTSACSSGGPLAGGFALWQVQPRQSEAGRLAPQRVRLPAGRQGARVANS